MITLTYAPEYYITEDTVYRVVESGDESDRPGTLVLEGYVRVDNTFAPRDKKKWFRCDRPDAKGVTAEELDAWKSLT